VWLSYIGLIFRYVVQSFFTIMVDTEIRGVGYLLFPFSFLSFSWRLAISDQALLLLMLALEVAILSSVLYINGRNVVSLVLVLFVVQYIGDGMILVGTKAYMSYNSNQWWLYSVVEVVMLFIFVFTVFVLLIIVGVSVGSYSERKIRALSYTCIVLVFIITLLYQSQQNSIDPILLSLEPSPLSPEPPPLPSKPWQMPDPLWWLRGPWSFEMYFIYYSMLGWVLLMFWIVLVQKASVFN